MLRAQRHHSRQANGTGGNGRASCRVVVKPRFQLLRPVGRAVLGTRYTVLRTPYSVLGTRYSALGTRYLFDTRGTLSDNPPSTEIAVFSVLCFSLLAGVDAAADTDIVT